MKIRKDEMTGDVYTLVNLINKKGITLVALVITIIILLILATVSIKLLIDSGIISKASYATNKYELKQEEEQIKLAVNSAIIDGKGIIIEDSLTQELNAQFGENNWEYSEVETEDCFIIKIKKSERQYKIYTKNREIKQYVEIKEEELFTYNSKTVTGLSQKGKNMIDSAQPGAEVKLVIPSIYKGKALNQIGISAFEDYNSITSVIIPDGIITLGNYSFLRCTSLTEVVMPNSLTTIGLSVFAYCTSLEAITIPEGVINIGSSAFINCVNLKEIILPDTLESIPYLAFEHCESLTNVVLPNSLKFLGWGSFRYCTSLTNVRMSETITTIQFNTFYGCPNLKEIEIPSSIINMGKSIFGKSGTKVKINKTAEEIKNIPDTDGTLYYPWGADGRIYDINGDIVK